MGDHFGCDDPQKNMAVPVRREEEDAYWQKTLGQVIAVLILLSVTGLLLMLLIWAFVSMGKEAFGGQG